MITEDGEAYLYGRLDTKNWVYLDELESIGGNSDFEGEGIV
ncbi:hypothetical protein RH858_08125 [Halalkaliarchaeum sp. AArc-GB]|nr:hypothetical protein [Halalkaliarchaeum sp. AArc-GB]MDR5673115.1 hypothetical protein [Halalkaliarchaeum sp. AArc-GB]